MTSRKKRTLTYYLNSIVKIYDLNGKEIAFSKLYVDYVKLPYSGTYSYILFIDDKPCSSVKRNYQITYKCRCGILITILLRKFLLKQRLSCQHCAQSHEFGDMGHNRPDFQKHWVENIREVFEIKNESKAFQEKYFSIHLYEAEFYKWVKHIYKINDTIITPEIIQDLVYFEAVPCNNQFKYTAKIKWPNGNIETMKHVYLKCDICGKVHHVHFQNLKNKNCDFIKCAQCAMTNTTFPIRRYKDTLLTYQSSIEYDFLERCEKYNIHVENGMEIPYKWFGKNKTYISDFFLPEYKLIMELKSNHIYYRMQMQNGKQDAKNNAAKLYAKNNGYEFRFLFDNMFDNFFDEIQNMKRQSEQQ